MAITAQKDLFAWQQIDELGHLEPLVLVIDTTPDEALMRTLECERPEGVTITRSALCGTQLSVLRWLR